MKEGGRDMNIRVTTPARGQAQEAEKASTATPYNYFEDFFNQWFQWAFEPRREGWKPAVDILERGGNFIIRIDAPGLNEKDIDLKIEGNNLAIKGEKRPAPESEGYTYHQAESFYGTFTRYFALPQAADVANIKAEYKNGVLTVTIPQKPEAQPRKISVKF